MTDTPPTGADSAHGGRTRRLRDAGFADAVCTTTPGGHHGFLRTEHEGGRVWIEHTYTRNGDTYHTDHIVIADPIDALRFAHALITAAVDHLWFVAREDAALQLLKRELQDR